MNKTNRILGLAFWALGTILSTDVLADDCAYQVSTNWSGGWENMASGYMVKYNCYTDSSHSTISSSTEYMLALSSYTHSVSVQDDGTVLITSNDGQQSYTLDKAPIHSMKVNGTYVGSFVSQTTLYDENHNDIGQQFSFKNLAGEVAGYTNWISKTTPTENGYITEKYTENTDASGKVIFSNTDINTYDENNNLLSSSMERKTPDGKPMGTYWNKTYTYDENGVNTFREDNLHHYNANGELESYTVNTSTYDTTGKRIASTNTPYDANGNKKYEALSTYDENGKQKTYQRTDYDVLSGNPTKSYDYEYYENGKYKSYNQDSYDSEGNKISSYGYEYYEDGKTKNYTSESYFADGSVKSSYSYENDENGKRQHEESLNYNEDGTFNNSYSRDFTYDENGRRIAYDQENFDALGNKIGTAEYRENYDEDGNWLGNSYVEKDADGNQTYAYDNVHTETDDYYADTFTEYDANGAVTNKTIDRYDYDEYGNEVWSWEQYDGNGNLLERDEDKYDDDGNYLGWTANYYTYDENGNVIGREFEDYTDLHDENGNYIGQKKLAYVYDEDGNLMKESESIYQKDENGNWGWSTISTKTYDKNGNLRSVTDANGVTTRYDKNGNPIVTKKIYTVEEATRLSKPTGNRFMLRYK